MPRKMSSTSRMVRLIRCSWPSGSGTPGRVTSMRSAASDWCSEALGKGGLALVDELFELDAHDVAELADHGALLGRQGRDGAQDLGEAALAAHHVHADLLERVGVGRRGGRRGGLVEQRGELGRAFLQVVQLGVVHGHSFEALRRRSCAPARPDGGRARTARWRRPRRRSATLPPRRWPGQRDGEQVGDEGQRLGAQAGALGAHHEQVGAATRRPGRRRRAARRRERPDRTRYGRRARRRPARGSCPDRGAGRTRRPCRRARPWARRDRPSPARRPGRRRRKPPPPARACPGCRDRPAGRRTRPGPGAWLAGVRRRASGVAVDPRALAERRRLGQREDRHGGGRSFEGGEAGGDPRVDRVDRSLGQAGDRTRRAGRRARRARRWRTPLRAPGQPPGRPPRDRRLRRRRRVRADGTCGRAATPLV